METFFESFQYVWVQRALFASSMVGVMCGVIGCFIVLRNMALIGDALAHAILPGVFIAFLLVGYSTLGFFVGSVVAGLVAALSITWIQHTVKTKNDAAIGIVFTAMFSIGVIGISWISLNQGVHLDLTDFLFGNVLGVSDEDLILTLVITLFVILSIVLFYRYLFISTFQPVIAETMGISVKAIHYYLMLLLSFAVVASLKTVGVILVVAMLITPAATALLWSNNLRKVLFISGMIGLISANLGFYFSLLFETTPGPAMALVATMIYLGSVLVAPKKGLISKYIQKRKLAFKIQQEDFLKSALKLSDVNDLNETKLREKLDFSKTIFRRHITHLKKLGFLIEDNNHLKLTAEGNLKALKLVRAHRLWETYLVNRLGLTGEEVHEDAEKFEHLLTDDLLDEVDQHLGFPSQDPHGSPIPTKKGIPSYSLMQLEKNEFATISKKQLNNEIVSMIWKMGLLPNEKIEVTGKENNEISLFQNGKQYNISVETASQISVIPVK